MSLFQKLVGSTGLTTVASSAAPAPAGGEGGADAPQSGLAEAQIEPMLQAAKAEGVVEGTAAGATAERERTAAVFASEEGKANMTMAAWMLAANPTATSESIIGQLKTLPVQAAAAPTAPTAKVEKPLAETPKVDLTGAKPAGAANDGAPEQVDTNALWDKAQASGGAATMGAGASITVGGQTLPKTGN
jgi:hypothetical protein